MLGKCTHSLLKSQDDWLCCAEFEFKPFLDCDNVWLVERWIGVSMLSHLSMGIIVSSRHHKSVMYLNEFCIISYQQKGLSSATVLSELGYEETRGIHHCILEIFDMGVSGGGCTLSLWLFHHSPWLRARLKYILVSFNGPQKTRGLCVCVLEIFRTFCLVGR